MAITSLSNPKIKNIIKLRKAGGRKKQDLIIIEGRHELELALMADIKVQALFYCPEFNSQFIDVFSRIKKNQIIKTSKKVFEKISYRENPDGFLALAKPKYISLADVSLNKNPLIIILEAVEKPGNLGAVLRSADAAGADAVIMADFKTDIYNPNVIRASLGTVFTNQIVVCSGKEAISWLKKHKIKSFAAAPDADKLYIKADFKSPSAIVIGTEREGLSEKWLEQANEKIKIPMQGKADSLNASVSAAVILFEAVRQRLNKA